MITITQCLDFWVSPNSLTPLISNDMKKRWGMSENDMHFLALCIRCMYVFVVAEAGGRGRRKRKQVTPVGLFVVGW